MSRQTDKKHTHLLAKKLIDETYAMTLATASHHIAWAAPVFYVSKGSHFYFFSNPKSRHILETLASGQAAATIYEKSSQWQELKGIQMSGKINAVSPGPEALNALGAYVIKFPLMNSFFSDIASLNLDGIFSRFQARLYNFSPDLIYYMDNAIDFGLREELQLEALGL
jgi:uncharacterized protein YhbP (UPF0306 family)